MRCVSILKEINSFHQYGPDTAEYAAYGIDSHSLRRDSKVLSSLNCSKDGSGACAGDKRV
ncbi:hypothetical protein CIPAW_01G051200 [Carya illinoinensis]|uniref:Uncharacterized protein n=1 Tax=Carya illinoinensis TaxID=32201 RepID=A0A8T1RJ34_CARIL|nr:hypothetical protein CIPAW_01G051200 [Carya illinoinensis]